MGVLCLQPSQVVQTPLQPRRCPTVASLPLRYNLCFANTSIAVLSPNINRVGGEKLDLCVARLKFFAD